MKYLMFFLSLGVWQCTPQKTKIMMQEQTPAIASKGATTMHFHLEVKERMQSKDTQVDTYTYQLERDQLHFTHQISGVHRQTKTKSVQLDSIQMERIRLYFERENGVLAENIIASPIKSTTGAIWLEMNFDFKYKDLERSFLLRANKANVRKDLAYLTVKTFQERLDQFLVTSKS